MEFLKFSAMFLLGVFTRDLIERAIVWYQARRKKKLNPLRMGPGGIILGKGLK